MNETILAIESSCDETGVAIVSGRERPKILGHQTYSQIELHKRSGGVVPEIAAREQSVKILPTLEAALDQAFPEKKDLRRQLEKIDRLAVTVGPGLAGSLLVGVNTAYGLSRILKKPLSAINHLEGHIYAAFEKRPKNFNRPIFPLLALIVSGGHSLLALMADHGDYRIIGETRDDAAGEAFDKIAAILDLDYPGGPAIANLALKSEANKQDRKTKKTIVFKRPMIDSGDFDFSFSGLKTAVLYLFRDLKKTERQNLRASIAREVQAAIVETLVRKTIKSAEQYRPRTILIGGGVSANKLLRQRMKRAVSNLPSTEYLEPSLSLATDNAAMIALAAWYQGRKTVLKELPIEIFPRLRLDWRKEAGGLANQSKNRTWVRF